MNNKYYIYADESDYRGAKFHNFYGATIVPFSKEKEIEKKLNDKIESLGIKKEIKWKNINNSNWERYTQILDLFFDYIDRGELKTRIFFRDGRIRLELTEDDKRNAFTKLYYQFLTKAFESNCSIFEKKNLKIRVDRLERPRRDQKETFKEFISSLSTHWAEFEIEEINSLESRILQCTDVVLGAMAFKLNGKHKKRKGETGWRPEVRRNKEKVYMHISRLIRSLAGYENFNVGATTGFSKSEDPKWDDPYRHWVFESSRPRK